MLWRNAVYWLIPSLIFSFFSYTAQTHSLEMVLYVVDILVSLKIQLCYVFILIPSVIYGTAFSLFTADDCLLRGMVFASQR